jgi:NmrA-like family
VPNSLFPPSLVSIFVATNPYIAKKRQVLAVAKEVGLPTLSVFTGFFSDYIFVLIADVPNGKTRIVGDGSAKSTFTRQSDIGKVLAKALADPDLLKNAVDNNAMLSIAAETLPCKEAIASLEKATGKKFQIEYLDPDEALKQEQDLFANSLKGDTNGSFILLILGEPARGSTGSDVSAEAKNYGGRMETLSEVL